MGCGSWDSMAWSSYSTSRGVVKGASVDKVYSAHTLEDSLNPLKFERRESRDNAEHPNSTPIIVALDVTGSMAPVLTSVATNLNTLVTETYNRNPVTDPQLMFMGVGDVVSDRCPIQVTQFESDIRIAEQLQKIYYERCGGSNDCESYSVPWYYAINHIDTDNYEKRGKKGYIFTIGDECPPKKLLASQIKKFIGDENQEESFSTEELLNEVSKKWEVFHLMIEEGNFMRRHDHDRVIREWTDLLGQRAILVSDHTKISEIIVATLERMSGKSTEDIIASWDGDSRLAIKTAISGLTNVETDHESDLFIF